MAMEQNIQAKMMTIARQFPDAQKAVNLTAAKQFRIPYWDPFKCRASNNDKVTGKPVMGISLIFCVKLVHVKGPFDIKWKQIENPLYQYRTPTDAQFLAAFGKTLKDLGTFTVRGGDALEAKTVRHSIRPSDDPLARDAVLNSGMIISPDSIFYFL